MPPLLAGAVLVVIGAALVQGGGRATIEGLGWALVALLCEGHILLEDVPGVGKTILARSLALSIGIHLGVLLAGAASELPPRMLQCEAFDGGRSDKLIRFQTVDPRLLVC